MKLNTILLEKDAPVVSYYAEFEHNEGLVGKWDIEETGDSFEQAVKDSQKALGVKGNSMYPGVWVGWILNEPKVVPEADEEGDYTTVQQGGEAIVIMTGAPDPNHPLLRKVIKEMSLESNEAAQDALYDHRDEQEYRADPHRYYGVSKRDFA